MSSYQKRRKPNFYSAQKSKKRREFVLKPGLKGFLCTCNSREKDCIRESYNVLNEYADNLYGKEQKPGTDATSSGASTTDAETHECESEEEDIEIALNKELDSLRAERMKPNMRRFQVIESGANNCIFIQTTLQEPVELVHHIMKDLDQTKKQKSRFLLRLLPIEATCKAYIEDIRQAADLLFDKYFTKEGKTFAVLFNRRNSSGLNREELIHDLAEMVLRRHPDNKADLKHPQLSVLVEVIRNMCCLSVLPDYFELRKYNLLELCSPEGGIKVVGSKNKGITTQGTGGIGEGDIDKGKQEKVVSNEDLPEAGDCPNIRLSNEYSVNKPDNTEGIASDTKNDTSEDNLEHDKDETVKDCKDLICEESN